MSPFVVLVTITCATVAIVLAYVVFTLTTTVIAIPFITAVIRVANFTKIVYLQLAIVDLQPSQYFLLISN